MRVKDLLEHLSKMNPDDHICAIVYDKAQFDFPDEDELILTDAGWEKICNEFDEVEVSGLWESVHMAVLDEADIRPFDEE